MSGEKRHEPSQKRLEKALREGRSCKSQILTQSFVVSTCFVCTFLICKFILVRNKILLEYVLTSGFDQPLKLAGYAAGAVALVVLVGLGSAVLAGLTLEFCQVGFRVNAGQAGLKLSRLDPLQGLSNIWRQIVQSWQMLLRFAVFLMVFIWLLRRLSAVMPGLLFAAPGRIWEVFGSQFFALSGAAGLALLLSGALEYILNRRQFMQELRMTDQEMREEQKEDQGDPMVRAMRRAQHEALARQDLVRRIRSSRVVVVEKN